MGIGSVVEVAQASPSKASDKKGGILSENRFFDLLVTNMDKDVREMAQIMLTFCVNRLFELGKREIIDSIMDIVF